MDEKDLEQVTKVIKDTSDAATATIVKDFDGMKEQLKLLEGQVKDVETQTQEIKTASKVVSVPGCDDGKDKGKFSFAKMLKGIGTNDWSDCGFEKEVLDAAQTKALSQGTSSAGGYLVPAEYIPEMIEMLREMTVLDKLGVTSLNPITSPVEIPRQTQGATAYWVAENTQITGSEQAFDQVSMSPKAVAALVKTSRRLVNMADPSIEQIVRRDIAMVLARAIDIKALNGDGTANTPVGIINTPGISTLETGADGDEFTYNFALDMMGKLEDENAMMGNLGFAGNPAVFRKLKKQAVDQYSSAPASGQQPLFAPVLSDENLAANLGYPIATTTALAKNLTKGSGTNLAQVIYGNWSDLLWATWGSMTIEASTSAGDASGGAFTSHQMWFKAYMEVDFAVRHPKSFALAPYVTTT